MPTKKSDIPEDDYYSKMQKDASDVSKGSQPKAKAPKMKVKKKVSLKSDVKKVATEKTSQTSPDEEKKSNAKVIAKKNLGILRDDPKIKVERKPVKVKLDAKKKEEKTSKTSEGQKPKTAFKSPDAVKKHHNKRGFVHSSKKSHESENTEKRKNKLAKHEKTGGKVRYTGEDTEFSRSHKIHKKKKKQVEEISQTLTSRKGETVILPDVIPLKELSEKIGIPIVQLIAEFMKNGMMVTLNSSIDFDSATIIAEAFEIKTQKDTSGGLSIDEIIGKDISALLEEDNPEQLTGRPPVISVMGHVDHGKTSLLDYIRSSRVAEKEAGGITQSIGAYQVEKNDQKLTFLDTPGHEAFTVMRARGAKSTDIAILVVAADEGVKPQTIESINHAKEADIPVIVAINKMDKEGANPDHIKGQLSEHGLTPEDWGGDTPMIPVSAKAGTGIDDLLDVLLLMAEMKELKANPERAAVATVIESHLDTKLGPVATVLINTGHLDKSDNIVCWEAYGKVKILKDHYGKNTDTSLPGDPVLIVGLDKVVEWGDILQVVTDVETARKKAIEFAEVMKNQKTKATSGLELLMNRIKAGTLKDLKIVLKADTNGSLEAIKASLEKVSNEQVSVSVIHSGVGNINESDALMANASQAILVGFNVNLIGNAQDFVESHGVELINHSVIYHITERVEAIATGMLDPKEVEIELGIPKVKAIFYTGKDYMVVGVDLFEDQKVEKWAKVRVLRKNKMVGKWELENVKQGVEDVNMLEGPLECGLQFKWDVKLEEKDVLEVYKIEIQK